MHSLSITINSTWVMIIPRGATFLIKFKNTYQLGQCKGHRPLRPNILRSQEVQMTLYKIPSLLLVSLKIFKPQTNKNKRYHSSKNLYRILVTKWPQNFYTCDMTKISSQRSKRNFWAGSAFSNSSAMFWSSCGTRTLSDWLFPIFNLRTKMAKYIAQYTTIMHRQACTPCGS